MKIATFNINNVNRRLPNLLRWLRAAKPDVVALQELKSTDEDFPVSAIDKAGYGAVWRGQKTWNGVAILARNADPVLIRNQLRGDSDDREARYISAASAPSAGWSGWTLSPPAHCTSNPASKATWTFAC